MDKDAVSAIVDDTLTAWQRETLPGLIAEHAPQNKGGPVIHMPELPAPVQLPEGELLHQQFTQILSWLRAGVPVWAWGAPGSGKTHMGRQLAVALGVDCYTMSIDETTTANKLLGFQNLVSGDFVPGWLYKPYLTGGLVVIDEIDTGNPGIIAGLNALVSNGHYMFPNGETVPKHPQFYVMACANTNGTGAIAGFTARQRLDAATLNRFALVKLEYDRELEKAICTGTKPNNTQWQPVPFKGEDLCARWVNWVQAVRQYAGKNVLISPRPSILGCKALRAGIPPKEVAEALVFALCAEDTAKNIRDNCGNPATL